MKKIVLMALMFAAGMGASAQDEGVETTVAADVVSSYIWRGQDCGSAAIQPTLGIGYKGLSLTAWGSYGLVDTNDAKEFDLTLAYTAGGFNIGLTDYWFNAGLDPEGRYFKYDAHGTNHIFEANIGYDFGAASVPFKVAAVDWSATVGAVPYATSFYGTDGFAITNLALKATKDIKVTDSFSIPVFAQVAANPCAQKAYFVFGFTLQP